MTKKALSLDELEVRSFVTLSDIRGGGETNIGICDESEFVACDTLVECEQTRAAQCGTDPEFCL